MKSGRDRREPDDDAAEAHTNPALPEGDREGGGRVKQRGANKGRKFATASDEIQLCGATARGRDCPRLANGGTCKFSHDLAAFLAVVGPNLARSDEAPELPAACPIFDAIGACFVGFKCRFLPSHVRRLGEGEGFQGSELELVTDRAKMTAALAAIGVEVAADGPTEDQIETLLASRGELNNVTVDVQRKFRTAGVRRCLRPLD